MNKIQKEIAKQQLKDEEEALKELKETYQKAKKDCEDRISALNARQDMQNLQSIIYQKKYQNVLLKQINGVLDDLNKSQYSTLNEFLEGSYANGYIGSMYDFQKQGVPITVPIDPKKVVRAIKTDSQLSESYYQNRKLPENLNKLKQNIRTELTRGIASGKSWVEVAYQVAEGMNSPFNKAMNDAMRIIRTEGHRVNQQGFLDAGDEAKKAGADIVKQWDATLDSKTRPAHAEADGQIVEWDDEFLVGGERMKAPSIGGSAGNVINCRCQLLQRARWALDEDELKRLQTRAEYFELDKSKSFDEFKQKYLKLDYSNKYIPSVERFILSKTDTSTVKKADSAVVDTFNRVFKGYNPSPLKDGEISECVFNMIPNGDGTYRVERYITNVAMSAGDTNVDIGNPALANSLHERIHDVINQIAMKGAGITDEKHVTLIQKEVMYEYKKNFLYGAYEYCFSDETFDEIDKTIRTEITNRAGYDGDEFVAESCTQYLGIKNYTNLSKKVYTYVVKGWKT